MKRLEVVAGIIQYRGRILCMQRGESRHAYVSGKYEFPGGKVEKGETGHEALMRELREEMNMKVSVSAGDYYTTVEHSYPDFFLRMHLYRVRVETPEFQRKEHIHHEWLRPEELTRLDWAPADRPVAEKLCREEGAVIRFDASSTRTIAHRGLSGLRMENTLEAFSLASAHGYWGIETDVHQTRDGEFIILHDDDTDRISGEHHVVSECTLEKLRNIPLRDLSGCGEKNLRMPLLREYIRICRDGGKQAVLEIKSRMQENSLEKLMKEISEEGMLEDTVFISFHMEMLAFIRKCLKKQRIQFLCGRMEENLVEKLADLEMDLDIHHAALTEEILNTLHVSGREVNVWTVDDPARAEELCSWGVDYLTTNILLQNEVPAGSREG